MGEPFGIRTDTKQLLIRLKSSIALLNGSNYVQSGDIILFNRSGTSSSPSLGANQSFKTPFYANPPRNISRNIHGGLSNVRSLNRINFVCPEVLNPTAIYTSIC